LSPAPERGARLFFALWPDAAGRDALAAWSRELRAVCGGRAPHPQDLHLTLAFLGSVGADRVGAIERAAAEVAPRAAALVLDSPGYWKHNRIVWAGASTMPPELESLVLDLRGALARSGIAFDAKRFVSHVTLLRDAREPASLPLLEPVRWDVEGFALAGSSQRPGGARYEILRSW
jgi:RNA 2',3'-cyclic 3'-phosphodiesterase